MAGLGGGAGTDWRRWGREVRGEGGFGGVGPRRAGGWLWVALGLLPSSLGRKTYRERGGELKAVTAAGKCPGRTSRPAPPPRWFS